MGQSSYSVLFRIALHFESVRNDNLALVNSLVVSRFEVKRSDDGVSLVVVVVVVVVDYPNLRPVIIRHYGESTICTES